MSNRKCLEGLAMLAFIFCLIMSILGIVNIAMIVVGSLNLDECKYSNAALFLMISGIAGCIACITAVFCFWFKPDSIKYFSAVAIVIMLAITIWGSVEVFGKFLDYIKTLFFQSLILQFTGAYEKVNYDENVQFYCPRGTYLFAFVILIIYWIGVIPLIVVCFIIIVPKCKQCCRL